MKRVYIAGKLNDMAVDYLYNVHVMMYVAQIVKSCGFSVYVPCMDLLLGIMFGYKKYHDYFDNSQPWLEAADAVFLVPGWQKSSGTKMEMELATVRKIPIFDDLEDLLDHFQISITSEIEMELFKFENVQANIPVKK